jgi:homocysteine S-methyltransferase
VRMAHELLAELHGLAQGVYLMPAFNRFDLVAEIIEAVRSLPPGGGRPAMTGMDMQEGG